MVSHLFKNSDTLESVAEQFNSDLKYELTPEMVEARMYDYEKLEKILFIRLAPLFLKNPVVKGVTNSQAKKVSAVISNLGILKVPEELSEYIVSYNAFCSTNSMFVVCLTYKDDLILGISSAYKSTQVIKDFIQSLSDEGIEITLYSNEVIDG